MVRESQRYLGLELSGAKNHKTSLAVLEFYPSEQKTFLLDIFDRVCVHEHQSADEALLELIEEFGSVSCMGVNVPLQLPPCIVCTRLSCKQAGGCAAPAVKWMREMNRKVARTPARKSVREFTPYTQRPIELWMRYQVLPKLPPSHRFEIDEALGGNRAPLTARMHFLQRHLAKVPLVEAWPKLSIGILSLELEGVSRRTILSYRHLETGTHAREEILEAMIEQKGVFIYERDLRKLSNSLVCFDAFICAYTAMLSATQNCVKPPAGFPLGTGWVHYPKGAECSRIPSSG